MLVEKIQRINKLFGVEFHDYERRGNSVLITSGFGINMALMDIFKDLRFTIDVDSYRGILIDWESIAVCIAAAKPTRVLLAGLFIIDHPEIFDIIKNGLVGVKTHIYVAGAGRSLEEFIRDVEKP